MLEFLQMRIFSIFILGTFASIVLSIYLGGKLKEENFENMTTYNLMIYLPFIILFLLAIMSVISIPL